MTNAYIANQLVTLYGKVSVCVVCRVCRVCCAHVRVKETNLSETHGNVSDLISNVVGR